jgi:hypothetical protein
LHRSRWRPQTPLLLALVAALSPGARAQERPFFITYNHQMEEPKSLEIALNPILGTQRGGNAFLGSWTELEYGVKGWWTTELYLDGQGTRNDGLVFTGIRLENRFRLERLEHRINPVLYVEFESLNEADKTLLEVVGHDVEADHAVPNADAQRVGKHEMEMKLILSSNLQGWNVAENIIAEKNLRNAPWEFGYAVGISRPLALAASPEPCSLCAENLTLGVEMFGGLGDGRTLGLKDTSHYLAPVVALSLPSGLNLRVSPSFGLNGQSHRFLLRFGVSYEIAGFPRRLRQALGGNGA